MMDVVINGVILTPAIGNCIDIANEDVLWRERVATVSSTVIYACT